MMARVAYMPNTSSKNAKKKGWFRRLRWSLKLIQNVRVTKMIVFLHYYEIKFQIKSLIDAFTPFLEMIQSNKRKYSAYSWLRIAVWDLNEPVHKETSE